MDNDIHDLLIDSVELVQIDVKNLKIGMFVSKLDRPWLETNFLFQGFELTTQADIEAVQRQCDFVYIDVSKQTRVHQYVSRSTGYSKDYLEKVQPPERRSSFVKEFKQAETVFHKTSTIVKSFMEEVQLGRPINVVVAKQAVAHCVDSVLSSPDALMLMTQLKKRDEYTAQHSMNVCIYSIALGRQINLSLEELNHLGQCGMMHDMGKMLLPTEVLNKQGRLNNEDVKILQSHTTKGWNLLLKTGGIHETAIDAAYMHHERMDGTGYPRNLKSDQITPYARIVAIADTYDAISSDRIYQRGRPHLEAIKILTESAQKQLDSPLTMKFIECLGIYPAGSIVELASGEVAVVIEVNPKAKLKPRVLILKDELGKHCQEHMVDLAMVSQGSDGARYTIKKVLRADECGIDLIKYYESGLFDRVLANVAS